jgi:peptidoglycan/xylan/chitin deacetylase (PgdA/CDA1 family)
VLKNVHSGSVILMHDGGGNRAQTVAALPTILKTLKAQGYGFRVLTC